MRGNTKPKEMRITFDTDEKPYYDRTKLQFNLRMY